MHMNAILNYYHNVLGEQYVVNFIMQIQIRSKFRCISLSIQSVRITVEIFDS